MKKLHLISLGCAKNLVDSEVMLGRLNDYEIISEIQDADVIIVNTCGFIGDAKKESLDAIFEADSKRKKDAILVVSGCLTERYKDEIAELIPEVDIFTGVGDYAKIDQLIAAKKSEFSNEVFLLNEEKRVITGSSYHAYIKIAEGCNQQCSFCAIPQFKGKLHSRTIESIVKELKRLTDNGYFDFTFIAQDTSSFYRDLEVKDGLIKLIDEVERVSRIKRARICYLYPSTLSKNTIDRIADSAIFAPYFDMPIQHISDSVLKVMKRGLDAKKTMKLIEKMRSVKNSYLRTSFIVGHPYENDNDFAQIRDLISSEIFDRVNVFAFSKEERTASFDMPEIDARARRSRMKAAEKAVKSLHAKKLKAMIGREIDAVIDGESAESEYLIAAKNLDFAPEIDPPILINDSEITLPNGEIAPIPPRQIVRAKITATTNSALIATLVGQSH
ncbi:MAG: 30S ribosomal protein S12 methylthiotransferase RimO [Helicobacteraceae bacterium]|nr:30S ribosomal protein S12 methylthiotransferase RimO [Helicobacteraceae bacterium]